MKKLMFAAAAIAAGVAVADVTSANIVGYQNKAIASEMADQVYTFLTATFRPVGGGQNSILAIQMNPECGSGDANFQRLDFEAGSACYYGWVAKADCEGEGLVCPEGANGVWAEDAFDEEGEWIGFKLPEGDDAILKEGETIQIDTFVGNTAQFNGQVSESNIVYPLDFTDEGVAQGYRFIGNAFPQDMSIQNVQMNAEAGSGDANFQRLDFEAGSACYYGWVAKADCEGEGLICPEGANGVWAEDNFDEEGEWIGFKLPEGEDAILGAGLGVQIDSFDGNTVTVLCPFDL